MKKTEKQKTQNKRDSLYITTAMKGKADKIFRKAPSFRKCIHVERTTEEVTHTKEEIKTNVKVKCWQRYLGNR